MSADNDRPFVGALPSLHPDHEFERRAEAAGPIQEVVAEAKYDDVIGAARNISDPVWNSLDLRIAESKYREKLSAIRTNAHPKSWERMVPHLEAVVSAFVEAHKDVIEGACDRAAGEFAALYRASEKVDAEYKSYATCVPVPAYLMRLGLAANTPPEDIQRKYIGFKEQLRERVYRHGLIVLQNAAPSMSASQDSSRSTPPLLDETRFAVKVSLPEPPVPLSDQIRGEEPQNGHQDTSTSSRTLDKPENEVCLSPDGEQWVTVFQGKRATHKNVIGMLYYHRILQAGEIDTLSIEDSGPAPTDRNSFDDAVASEMPLHMIDSEDVRKINKLISAYEERLLEAPTLDQKEQLESELTKLIQYRNEQLDIHGNPRPASGDGREKARGRITNALMTANSIIAKRDQELAKILKKHIKVNRHFARYEPRQ